MESPKPFIICMGLPGCGKTTSSKKLEEELEGYTRIHLPEVRAKIGLKPYAKRPGLKKLYAHLRQYYQTLTEDQGIVFDRIASTNNVRQYMVNIATISNRNCILIEHIASEEVSKRRISARQDPGNTSLPTNDPAKYDKFARIMEPFGEEWHYGSLSLTSVVQYDTENGLWTPKRVRSWDAESIEEIKNILM